MITDEGIQIGSQSSAIKKSSARQVIGVEEKYKSFLVIKFSFCVVSNYFRTSLLLLLSLLLLCSRQVFPLSIHCNQVQAVDLPWGINRERSYISDSTFLIVFGCTKHCDFLDFIGANVTQDSTSDLV